MLLDFLHSFSKLLEIGCSKKGFSWPSVKSSRMPLLHSPGGTSVLDSLGERQGNWTPCLNGRSNKKYIAVFHLPYPPSLTYLWHGTCEDLSEIMNRKHLAQHLIHNNHSIKGYLFLVFASSLAKPSFSQPHPSSPSLSLSIHTKLEFFPFWKWIWRTILGEKWERSGIQLVLKL